MTCTLDFECASAEVCAHNQCVSPCAANPQACGLNADCRCEDHQLQCQCPSGFTGNPAAECVRIPLACQQTADCATGATCRDSMCLPQCGADQECALNEKCLSGNCMRK